MQVNHSLRRIASLSAFVLAISITSASQAGVIPWVYDAIFGPVHYRSYGYSPYAVSYSRPVVIRSYAPASYGYSYAPASGCAPCSTSYYVPVSYSMPSSGCGSCGPVAMAPLSGPCGTVTYTSSTQGCLSGCSVSPATATSEPAPNSNKTEWTKKKSKTAESDQGTSTTVTPSAGSATDDGLGTSGRSRGKAKTDVDAIEETRPASGELEPTILNKKKAPAKTPEDGFEPPLENNKPAEINKPEELELQIEKKIPDEAQLQLPLPKRNLDAKIAWRTEPQRTRALFHAKLAKASVTRRTTGADSDWTPVVAKVTGTQFVKK
ncbi:MAG: hypothetical protein IAG10_09940 [Planctomycetaceae bacterium]|nr:hypothetical protein [Planctomycetaceae bacterium]